MKKASVKTNILGAYLDFKFGHESNINNATSTLTVIEISPFISSLSALLLSACVEKQIRNFAGGIAGILFGISAYVAVFYFKAWH